MNPISYFSNLISEFSQSWNPSTPNHSEEINRCNYLISSLEKFQDFLSHQKCDAHAFDHRFHELDHELKEIIGKAIWMACYRPEGDAHFAEHFLRNNASVLFNCKNESGTNLISQILNHYRSKARLYSYLDRFNEFALKFAKETSKEARWKLFQALPDYLRGRLSFFVWHDHGGKHNAKFGYWGYGEEQIQLQPSVLLWSGNCSMLDLCKDELCRHAKYSLLDGLEKYGETRKVPHNPIPGPALSQTHAPERRKRVLMCSAEVEGVVSSGGLAPAVGGMIRGYGKESVRLVAPKYDIIKIPMQEKKKYEIHFQGKVYKVFKAKLDGVKCYFIDSPEYFNIGFNKEGKPNKIYFDIERDLDEKKKWLQAQSLMTEFGFKLSQKQNPIEVIHVHDAQMALIPKLMTQRHHSEWKAGKTPAVVFSVHNNLCPINFNYHEAQRALTEIGLSNNPINALVEGVNCSEVVVPVSKQFALEVQTERFGNGMQRHFKIAALEGKLIGVPNGDSKGWNPEIDPQLKNWYSLKRGKQADLSYGPNHPDLASQNKVIRKEAVAYIKHHFNATFDPKKPTFLYVGRFCSGQKGVDMLPMIAEELLANGAQFICMGTDPDPKASECLKTIEKMAKKRGNKGVLVIRDFRDATNALYWQQTNKCGSLFRAFADWAVFPSKFEPFGFVQGEMHRMGKKTLATKTGGFCDTIITSGPNANGLLFERLEWESEEQKQAIRRGIREAAKEAHAMVNALYGNDEKALEPYLNQMRTIMTNALNTTWTKTFDGSMNPTDQMHRVYHLAIEQRSKRGVIFIDIFPLNIS
jgi:glycogen synthase